jgi:hypothetical protein
MYKLFAVTVFWMLMMASALAWPAMASMNCRTEHQSILDAKTKEDKDKAVDKYKTCLAALNQKKSELNFDIETLKSPSQFPGMNGTGQVRMLDPF